MKNIGMRTYKVQKLNSVVFYGPRRGVVVQTRIITSEARDDGERMRDLCTSSHGKVHHHKTRRKRTLSPSCLFPLPRSQEEDKDSPHTHISISIKPPPRSLLGAKRWPPAIQKCPQVTTQYNLVRTIVQSALNTHTHTQYRLLVSNPPQGRLSLQTQRQRALSLKAERNFRPWKRKNFPKKNCRQRQNAATTRLCKLTTFFQKAKVELSLKASSSLAIPEGFNFSNYGHRWLWGRFFTECTTYYYVVPMYQY